MYFVHKWESWSKLFQGRKIQHYISTNWYKNFFFLILTKELCLKLQENARLIYVSSIELTRVASWSCLFYHWKRLINYLQMLLVFICSTQNDTWWVCIFCLGVISALQTHCKTHCTDEKTILVNFCYRLLVCHSSSILLYIPSCLVVFFCIKL